MFDFATAIADWFTAANPQWHVLDDVEVEGEIRCNRCNRMDFANETQLQRHKKREHTPPVITGTLAYKRAHTQGFLLWGLPSNKKINEFGISNPESLIPNTDSRFTNFESAIFTLESRVPNLRFQNLEFQISV